MIKWVIEKSKEVAAIIIIGSGAFTFFWQGAKLSEVQAEVEGLKKDKSEQTEIRQQMIDVQQVQVDQQRATVELIMQMFQINPEALHKWKEVPTAPMVRFSVDSLGDTITDTVPDVPWIRIEQNPLLLIHYMVKYDSVTGEYRPFVDTTFPKKRK